MFTMGKAPSFPHSPLGSTASSGRRRHIDQADRFLEQYFWGSLGSWHPALTIWGTRVYSGVELV